MKGKYLAPSELLKLQKETGRSYWDLVGRPLYDEGKDDEEKASSGQISALKQLLSDELDTKYLIPDNMPNTAPLNYADRYGLTGDIAIDGRIAKFKKGKEEYVDSTVVYQKLRNLGFDHNSALGVLGNAMQESTLRPNVRAGSYSGLLQNNKNLRAAIEDMYGNYGLDAQLQYVSDWADGKTHIKKGAHRAHTALYSGSYKKTGYKSPEEAAIAFMKLYERPVILDANKRVIGYQNQRERVNFARQFAKDITGGTRSNVNQANVQTANRRPAQQQVDMPKTHNNPFPWLKTLSPQELEQMAPRWNPPAFRLPSTMSIEESSYHPEIPEYINRASATAAYPRTTALPQLLEYIGKSQKLLNESPLYKPVY